MKKLNKECKWCKLAIPATRKRSARYCSDACYYEAKKERSIEQYRKLKQPNMEVARNEKILAHFYQTTVASKPVVYDDLEIYMFNWGISTGETSHDGKICRIINGYAYYLCPKTKNVSIWKLKQSQSVLI